MADAGPDDWVVPQAAPAPAAAPAGQAPASAPVSARQSIDAGPDDWVTPAAVNAPPVSTAADVAKAVPSGLAVGTAAAAGTPGGILDAIGNGSEWLMQRGLNAVGALPKGMQPQSYSDIAASNRALTRGTDILPRTEDILQAAHDDAGFTPYEPKTVAGQFAGKTAEMLPSTLAGPGGLAAKGAMAAGSAAGDMAAGAVTQGTYLEPYARAAGALAGGVGSALTIHGAQALAPAVSDAAARSKAAGLILDNADDAAALRARVAADTGDGQIVPGSAPTSFQRYGDVGLGDIEKAVQTRNPKAFVSNPYGTGTEQQNAAQVAAMKGVQTGGASMSVPDLFLSQKRGLEDFHDFMSGQAEADARSQADALGGAGTATQTGQAIKGAVDPQFQAAQTGAQAQTAALGGTDRVDVYGSGMRGAAQDAADASAEQYGRLFDAVPDDMAVPLGSVQRFGAQLYGNLGPAMRKTVTPAEQDIQSVLGQYGPNVSFGEARNLDTLVTGAMRAERRVNGSSAAYARMAQIKGQWEGAIRGALGIQADADDAAVAAGTMDPSETIGAKLQAATGDGGAAGAPAVAFTPAGTRIGTSYGVADLGDLVTSHAADGTPNPAFPAELQPRDRTRAASQAQISGIASNLQPERLGFSTSTTDGAPVIGPDNVVESGNGRALALGQAYATGGPQAKAYRDWLTGQGYDVSGMDRPILVRQRTTPLSDADRVALTQESNAPSVLSMSAPEKAAADAGRMSDATLGSYQGGDVASAANRPFVRSFMGSVPDAGERGALAAGDGSLSMEGATRVRNALLHAGYGDTGLVSSLAETADPSMAAFGRALQANAGGMAQLRRGIAAGEIHPGADLSAPAVEAGRVVQRARSTGQRLGDAMAQQDAFNPVSPEATAVLRAAYGPDYAARLNNGRLSSILGDAIGEARQQTTSGRLFDEPLSARQMVEGATARYAQANGTAGDEAARVAGAGAGDGEARAAGRGPGPAAGGPGSAGEGGGSARGAAEAGRAGQGVASDLESRVFHQAVPAEAGHRVVPVDADKVDVLTGWQPDYRIEPGAGGPTGKLARASDFISNLGEGQSFRPPTLGVHDQGMGFDNGRHRFSAMRDLGFKTVPVSMDPASEAAARRLGLVNDAPPRSGEAATGVRGGAGRNILPDASPAGPPVTQEALDSLTAAKDAFKEHVATYRKGPVGAMLRSDGTAGSYATPDSAVPGSVFRSGNGGYQSVTAYRRAVGDSPAAADMLHGYAAASLRKAALQDDGTLNPAAYARWRNTHGEAFRGLPASVQARFNSAGTAAQALDRFGSYSPSLAPSAVPEMFFAPGKAGGEGVDRLRSLIGDDHAETILSDHAASVLKAKAERPDGTIDPRGLQSFLKSYGPAMDRLPGLADRFGDAAKATQTIGDVAAGRATALKNLQATAAGKFMGLSSPAEVRDQVGRMIEGGDVTGLRNLMKQAAADPAAVEGVKRAAADHMLSRGLSEGTEAGASGVPQVNRGTFQGLVGKRGAALGQVFDDGQMNTLRALSEDMMRQKRTETAVRVKASPNTAADLIRAMKFEPKGHAGSLLREVAEAAIGGEELGGAHGAELGAALAVGNKARSALRDAGMRRTYDVMERAVLDPEFFRTLLMSAPKTAGTGSHVTLASRLGRYSMFRGIQAETAAQDDRKAS